MTLCNINDMVTRWKLKVKHSQLWHQIFINIISAKKILKLFIIYFKIILFYTVFYYSSNSQTTSQLVCKWSDCWSTKKQNTGSAHYLQNLKKIIYNYRPILEILQNWLAQANINKYQFVISDWPASIWYWLNIFDILFTQ